MTTPVASPVAPDSCKAVDTPPGFDTMPGIERLGRNRFRLSPGVTLFRQGERGTHAFWIESGRVDLTRMVGDIPMILALANAGEIIGEMALIDGGPRSASATTAQETVLTSIPAAKFQSHIDSVDPLVQSLLRKFSRIIRSGNEIAALNGQGMTIGQ